MIRRNFIIASSLLSGTAALALSGAAIAQSSDNYRDAALSAEGVETLQSADDDAGTPTPTMSFGTWGVDPAAISKDIDPGDDFFGYVNQNWLDANPLPAEYSRFGAFDLLREKSTTDVKTILDQLLAKDPASRSFDEQRIVAMYESFLDTDAIEAAGIKPVQPYINEFATVSSLDELAALWAKPGYPGMIGGFVNVDAKQPDRYVASLGGGGLGLPDRDYYLDTSEKGREIQSKYRDYVAFLLGEAGYADPVAAANAVYGMEDRIARTISWDRTVLRNRDLTYHALSLVDLEAFSGDYPIAQMLQTTGLDKSPIYVVGQIPPTDEEIKELGLDDATLAKIGKGLPGMFELLSDTPLATLQAWSIKTMLDNNTSRLPTRFDEASFDFYGKLLRGTPEQRPRYKRSIAATDAAIGELVGRYYVADYFPPENKAAMDALVANLRSALGESITELNWMSEATKKEARDKLASFDPKVGYRDNLEVYKGLEITDSPVQNAIAVAEWNFKDNVSKLGQPIDRTEWGILPQTVNAYYNPTKNEIVFPAAILQQPFFALTNDPAVNYGGIGGVIGHEMGHGFDDQGSKYDSTGKLRNWWTDTDRANFDKRTDALVAQYDAFCPLDNGETCVNGRFTLGENIGDLGGLSLAYRAYKLATAGQDVPVINGFTGDQRFFLAWSQVWRSEQREANFRQRLRTDPHSPEQYRVNGVVRNLDEWYEAFGITEDDALYIPPEERVRIW